MSSTLAHLYDDNQKTSAIGTPPTLCVTQGGTADKTVSAIAMLTEHFARVDDAREIAFTAEPPEGLGAWPKKSEATGIHAEMIIVRAWLVQEMSYPRSSTLEVALASLKGRRIVASQPACWYCHSFMAKMGIDMGDDTLGKKPGTGWRNPITGAMTTNADMPQSSKDVKF